jgi:selenocysteine lyase/cysteine desulfurase
MDTANRELAVNAGRGSYRAARVAENTIDETRNRLLNLVHGQDSFYALLTPSATIAFNQIIFGLDWKNGENVYVSPYEHNSVMRTLNMVRKMYGINIIELPLNSDLTLDIKKTKYFFAKDRPEKLFISHVSNVTGYILPIKELSDLAKEYNSVVCIDASQSLGLVNVDLRNIDIDFLVFAGHKTLYGPLGVGGFLMKCGNYLKPYIAGGTGTDSLNLNMPDLIPAKYEPASTNIVAIAGLCEALKEIEEKQVIEEKLLREQQLNHMLSSGLEKIDGVNVYHVPSNCGTGITAFCIEGYQAADVGMILDEDYDIAVRTGYHCAPLIHKYLADSQFMGVVRASIGKFNTKEDIEKLLEAVEEIAWCQS